MTLWCRFFILNERRPSMDYRKHICLLHSYGVDGSGSSVYTIDLANELVKFGYRVSVICHETRLSHLKNNNKQLNLKNVHIPYCETRKSEFVTVFSLFTKNTFVAYDRPELSNTKPINEASHDEIMQHTDEIYKFLNYLNCKNPIEQILVNHLSVLNLVASQFGKKNNVPFKTIVHGTFLEYAINRNLYFKKLVTYSLEQTSAIFVLNESVKSRFLKTFDRFTEKVKIVPPGLNQTYFDTNQVSPQVLASEHKVISYVGRISLDKGLHCLLVILPLLSLKHKFTLKIAGDGPDLPFLKDTMNLLSQGRFREYYEKCEEYIGETRDKDIARLLLNPLKNYLAKYELNKLNTIDFELNVDWLGHLSKQGLEKLYKKSEYNVLTSLVPEAHPLVICEALACGTMTIAKNFSGITELYSDLDDYLSGSEDKDYQIEDDHTTFIEELFKVCDRYLQKNTLKELSPQLKEFAKKSYSWSSLARKILYSENETMFV